MADGTTKRKVLLGVTGSIAAYKSAELARLLIKRGQNVRVMMTPSAQKFITPITMRSITENPVTTDFWEEPGTYDIGHITLADWADVVLIAPATADFLARMVAGFADTPLHATVLATKAPILIAPAMNTNMYNNVKTQENIEILKSRGVQFVEPEVGELACGWSGVGRMANPWEIFHHTLRTLSEQDYAGRKMLISTGPTREPIDPVRSITSRSSGKMGVALAREAWRRGAEVTLVHGPVPVKVPAEIRCIGVETAIQMRDAVMAEAFPEDRPAPDTIIMAAAVADFRPEKVADHKIKKTDVKPAVKLVQNPDILSELGEKRGDNRRPLLVGFAVETGELDDLFNEISEKMQRKKADMIIGNFAEDAFDLDTNRVWMIDRNGKREEVATTFKSRVASKIFNKLIKL